MASGPTIPQIPDWDGVGIETKVVPSNFKMKMKLCKTTVKTDGFFDPITAQETAGSGFRLASVFLPVSSYGKRRGLPLDLESSGMMKHTGKAMMILQKDNHVESHAVETQMHESTIDVCFGIRSIEVKGYEELYNILTRTEREGFSLSAFIDIPNTEAHGWASQGTTVQIITQKSAGISVSTPNYVVCNCAIRINMGLSMKAKMPDLVDTLQQHTTQGKKIASIYNPPNVASTGLMSAESACHIIFQEANCNYFFTVCDSSYTASPSFGKWTVDHSEYLPLIDEYGKRGWELAAIIDLPDAAGKGFSTGLKSTIKLIFQAPHIGGIGGFVQE